MPTIDADPLDVWGRILKCWSTGLDYLNYLTGIPNPSTDPTQAFPADLMYSPSMTKDGLNQLIANIRKRFPTAVGALTLTIPDGVTIKFVQGDDSTVVLNLPPKNDIAGADAGFLSGAWTWTLAPYDAALYNIAPSARPPNPPTTKADEMTLLAEFMGDYVIRNCRR